MKFSEMPYARPDAEQVKKTLAALTERVEKAKTYGEARAAFTEEDALQRHLDTLGTLAEIRHTVDEQLQDALQKRLTESFRTVSAQLEQVHKGLGEMQTLASDVGGLKQVLSGVKTRGILGEIQLGASS